MQLIDNQIMWYKNIANRYWHCLKSLGRKHVGPPRLYPHTRAAKLSVKFKWTDIMNILVRSFKVSDSDSFISEESEISELF